MSKKSAEEKINLDMIEQIKNLSDDLILVLGSAVQASKIKAGNKQEEIVKDAFNELKLPNISVTLHEEIVNETRTGRTSKVDVTISYYGKPIIGIDVKNGGSNGTDSSGARSNDVVERVKGASEKGYKYYVYLSTPAVSPNQKLEHVDIAEKELSFNSSNSCKLFSAKLNEKDPNLQKFCNIISELVGQSVDTSVVMNSYHKVNSLNSPSLKEQVIRWSEQIFNEKEVKKRRSILSKKKS